MLAMLGDLSERMGRMESSQHGQVGGQRKESAESSVLYSVLGSGAGITLQALEHTPPPKRSPNVSPATYFGFRRPALAGDHMADASAQENVNHGMAQGVEPGIHGHAIPAGAYRVCRCQVRCYTNLGRYTRVYRMVVNGSYLCISTVRSSTSDLEVV